MKRMSERWAPIAGYEGKYEVSDHGRVRSLDRKVTVNGRESHIKGRLLKISHGDNGYPAVTLWSEGAPRKLRVHRLVAVAFVPGQSSDHEVCHNDGSRSNNHFNNLRWGSRKSNVQDMLNHGRHHLANRTECPHGHPYDAANTLISNGRRVCRECRNALRRRRRAETSEARKKRDERDRIILEMDSKGFSRSQISAAVGFTQAGVRAALRRLGRERSPQAVSYGSTRAARVEPSIDDIPESPWGELEDIDDVDRDTDAWLDASANCREAEMDRQRGWA